MKKLIGALALAAMVAASAFAEVSFGAWVCNLPTLIASDGDGIQGGGVSNPWGGWRPARADISFTSDDGKAGMVLGVYTGFDGNNPGNGNGGSIGNADNTLMWIKPIDQIRLSVGAMDNWFGTRSDLCYGSWNWLRPDSSTKGVRWGEGITFSATTGWDMAGLGVEIMPVEALKIFAFVPLQKQSVKTLDKVFGKGWYGAMYTIDGIGKLKAQLIADSDENDAGKKKIGTIEAAFDLTAVDKLFATVGVDFILQDSDRFNKGDKQFGVALGASYGITEAFKVAADFSLSIPKDGDMGMAFGAGLDYAVSDALGLTADVRMVMPNNDIDPSMSFLVGATYAVGSNASLGLGFQAAVAMGDKMGVPAKAGDPAPYRPGLKVVNAAQDGTSYKKFIFAVPLRFSTWF